MPFEGRTVVVTGGTGALGSVVATAFLDRGASVAIPSHSELSPDAVRQLFPLFLDEKRPLLVSKADVTLENEVRSFCEKVVARFASIDILLNIAGGYAGGSLLEETSLTEWDSMFTLNLKSAFLMSRQVLPLMRAKKAGRIVTIAARQALFPSSNSGPYAIAKGGVVTLTRILADETKGTGITVNAVAPGIIDTPANARNMKSSDRSRWVSPNDIADLILHLCSDSSGSISGNIINAFGG